MKMNKNMTMIIAGAVVLFLVYWFFFRKKTTKTESGYMTWLGLPSESAYKEIPAAGKNWNQTTQFPNPVAVVIAGGGSGSGFKKCSCSAVDKDGKFTAWEKTCSKSVLCKDCCETIGNADAQARFGRRKI